MINGVFILFVFVSHGIGYLPQYNGLNLFADHFLRCRIGQLMVAAFLFHSGYGVAVSILKKGCIYVEGMPRRRVLPVFLHFAIAVTMFAVLKTLIGDPPSWSRYAYSLIGWESVGNSNWYIFVILCLYLFVYFVSIITRNIKARVFLLCLLCVGLIFFLRHFKPGQCHWWNTIPCFPAGFILAYIHEPWKKIMLKQPIPPFVIGILTCAVIIILKIPVIYSCVFFAYGMALSLSGIRFQRKPTVLLWLGKALFSVYIFQRMPMLILSLNNSITMPEYQDIFLLLSLILTCIIAWGMGYVWKYLDSYIR